MTTLYLSPITFILQQVFTNNGVMAQGGQAFITSAGTGILVITYTDSTGVVQNANPLTLNSAGRIASASGAPVSVWAPSGTVLTLQVVDNQGNQLIYVPFIAGINDPAGSSSLQSLLASPASSSASGIGPVAGADLVANAMKSYAVFANVRAANAPTPAPGQTLIIGVEGANSVGDGLGGLFYWSASSTAADNGSSVIDPTNESGAGRYLRLSLSQTNQFSATLSDGVNSIATPITYTVSNGVATLYASAGATFTSAANSLTMTGLPPIVTPVGAQIIPCWVEDNSQPDLLGLAYVTAAATVVFSLANTTAVSGRIQTSATGFTSSGTKGIPNWAITYGLN